MGKTTYFNYVWVTLSIGIVIGAAGAHTKDSSDPMRHSGNIESRG